MATDDETSKRVLQQRSIRKRSEDKPEVSKKRIWIRKIFSVLFFWTKPLRRPTRWFGRHFVPKYFRNSVAELRLVTWPNRKQSRQLTTAVVLFAIVLGTTVSLVDYGLDKLFKKVILKQ